MAVNRKHCISVSTRVYIMLSLNRSSLRNKKERTPFVPAPTIIAAPELGIKMKVDSPVIFIKPAILFRTVAPSLAYESVVTIICSVILSDCRTKLVIRFARIGEILENLETFQNQITFVALWEREFLPSMKNNYSL